MCSIKNKTELEKKIEEIRKYKAMAEEASNIEKSSGSRGYFLYDRK